MAVAFAIFLGLLAVTVGPADAWASNRHDRCNNRADNYAADDHPNLTPQEIQERTDWLYAQCAENDAAEAIAQEHGAMAPELFPNTEGDRHAHPLHCMSLEDDRFGMHNNHDSANPPADPTGPGGAAALNIPGEFMYAYVDGEPRFMVRYVVWTIDDLNGDVVTPVRIKQQPTYQMTPQVTVAIMHFTEAYVPVSVWVELPDTLAVANEISGVLPGRSMAMRSWMKSKCHDKRYPTVMPQMLIDHVQNLGWLDPGAIEQAPRAIRFTASGDPDLADSWSLTEVPVTLPDSSAINSKADFRWFYDADLTYEPADTLGPVMTTDYAPGTVFTGPSVPLSGTASDPAGVSQVFVAIQNSAGDYLQEDGSFMTAPAQLSTDLEPSGASLAMWSLTVDPPPDDYMVEVIGEDALGNSSSLTNADFVVDPAGPDVEAPTIDMDHEINSVFVGPSVTITGWANDNTGVTDIQVTFKDRVTSEWLQSDGSFGPNRVLLPVDIDNPGGQFTTWATTVTLPDGSYNVESFASDAAGNEGDNPTWKKFEVGEPSDTENPTANVDHAKNAQFIGPDVTITGTATDNTGVTTVQVKLKDRDTGLWLQADGTYAGGAYWHPAAVNDPGGASVTWSVDFDLLDGRYNPVVRAFDAAGNEGAQTNFRPIVVTSGGGVDDEDPTVNVDHAKNAEFTGPAVTITGTAADNIGVMIAEVKIKDRDTGLWLQPDGSFASGVSWHTATIDAPGSTNTSWSIDFTLADGRYNPVARAHDAAGNDGVQTAFRPIKVV